MVAERYEREGKGQLLVDVCVHIFIIHPFIIH